MHVISDLEIILLQNRQASCGITWCGHTGNSICVQSAVITWRCRNTVRSLGRTQWRLVRQAISLLFRGTNRDRCVIFSASFTVLLFLLVVGNTLALYSPSDDVVDLNPSNFDSKVIQSDDLWFVEFYAPWQATRNCL